MGGSCRTLNFISAGSPSTHIPAGSQLTKKKGGGNREASTHCLQKKPAMVVYPLLGWWATNLALWQADKNVLSCVRCMYNESDASLQTTCGVAWVCVGLGVHVASLKGMRSYHP
jgi:hypothetical protein